ncbi:CPBP family intramembrane glutamic endopeptidase [Natronolimnohabitans sp. A-GB9]|uniref:CPBP family intramembrane glutamic endopeptidase n=1 Tax=Natronolimnohabitans sp. A-GB9 TaxID=3069757 RepID=UPI0027B1B575|nr:CPBP family intramembrane glutamic endopeptidase [Natronolimnohabitans sp. A-GB9]MDQ2049933.1 CPBP family intramembrane glutamic endopeptidase [Natronolimnohabitans sp. A-GB9]
MSTRRSVATSIPPRVRALGLCLVLAVGGWLTGFAATLGVEIHLLAQGYDAASITQIGASVAFNVVGAGGLALTYLIVRRNGFDRAFVCEFLRVRRPTIRDLAWVVVGLVGAFVVLAGYQTLVELVDPFGTGGEGETHSSIEEGRQYPALFLVGIPIAIFLTGPGEELLYRGVIQSRLDESFPTTVAILLAAVVFTVVHLPVYMGDEFGAVLVSLGTVGSLGLYLGVLYELSDTLVVPAVIHGLFNATVYLTNFLTYA